MQQESVIAVSSCHLERSAAQTLAPRKRQARSRKIPTVRAQQCRWEAFLRRRQLRTYGASSNAEVPVNGNLMPALSGSFDYAVAVAPASLKMTIAGGIATP